MGRLGRTRGASRVAMVAFAIGLVLSSLAVILAIRVTSTASEAASAQRVSVQDEASRAAARLAREVDAVRLAASITAVDSALVRVASSGGAGTAADLAAARRPLEVLSESRKGLISIARLRTVSGKEILRVSDRDVESAMASSSVGSPWIGQAISEGAGAVVTTAPHNSVALTAKVISTATPVGGFADATGVLEIETPVEWLEGEASGGDSRITVLMPDGADPLFSGTASGQDAGVSDVGSNVVGWARTDFDDRVAGSNEASWVVTYAAEALPAGLDAIPALMYLLFALALGALGTAALAAFNALRRRRADRVSAQRASEALQASLADMSTALSAVADGDLATELPVHEFTDDVLRGLAGSFDTTLVRLRALVSQAQQHGSALAQASVELRASAAGQASAATEQSNVVAETTATIEELAATAAQIAKTAEQVATAASHTLRLTEDGRSAVLSSVDAMEVVESRVTTIGERAVSLGDTGQEISRIVDVIDDLAERTNMLALNAAIEAARAGEHGQGFAVVAAEVRRLAERARSSTTQIQALVTRIATESGATVLAAEDGQREVESAREVAAQAANALDRIAGMVDETTMATREISIATAQQQSASDQVVVAMSQVSAASQQYAAGSRQAEASARELALLAEAIHQSIGTLTVKVEEVQDVPAEAALDDDIQPADFVDATL